MNLYRLHTNPDQLKYSYTQALDNVPEVAWREFFYSNQYRELRKREHLWTESADYAFYYAQDVLTKPWPPGEEAIARNPSYSHLYARNVLYKPFPKGERAISSSGVVSYWYAVDVLKARFPLGEPALAAASGPNPLVVAKYMNQFGLKLVDGEFIEKE